MSMCGLYKCHYLSKNILNFGCIDGCGRLNRSRILEFEKISDLDSDSKLLEKERSLSQKM